MHAEFIIPTILHIRINTDTWHHLANQIIILFAFFYFLSRFIDILKMKNKYASASMCHTIRPHHWVLLAAHDATTVVSFIKQCAAFNLLQWSWRRCREVQTQWTADNWPETLHIAQHHRNHTISIGSTNMKLNTCLFQHIKYHSIYWSARGGIQLSNTTVHVEGTQSRVWSHANDW